MLYIVIFIFLFSYIVHIVYCYTSLLVHLYSSYCILLLLVATVAATAAAVVATAAATAVAVIVVYIYYRRNMHPQNFNEVGILHFFTRADCPSNLSFLVSRSTLQSLCNHYFCYISAACMYVDLISGYSNVNLDTARCTLIT